MLENLPSFEIDLLARLRFNTSEAARICGITARQLKYWADKGFISTVDDSEQCFDIRSMEKAILIRRALNEGHTLEMASRLVRNYLSTEEENQRRLSDLDDRMLTSEIENYLEQLEERLETLRAELPNYLMLSRLGGTALPLDLRALEQFFLQNPNSFDTAPNLAFRLGYAVDEVERCLEALAHANVLVKGDGGAPIFHLQRQRDLTSPVPD